MRVKEIRVYNIPDEGVRRVQHCGNYEKHIPLTWQHNVLFEKLSEYVIEVLTPEEFSIPHMLQPHIGKHKE